MLLLSQRVSEDNKEFSDILNTVDASRKDSPVVLHTQAVLAQYEKVSKVINSTDAKKKDIRKKSIKAMMQESVFHGAGWMGNNFIA